MDSEELGKGATNTEGTWGCLLRKNDILEEENQVLSDYEIMTAIRNRRIVKTYKFRDEIMRHAESTGRTRRLKIEVLDLSSSDEFLVRRSDIDRNMQREMGDSNRWGNTET